MSIFERTISLLAPPICVGCGVGGVGLCEGCIASQIVGYGERCWRCGRLSAGCRTCKSCRWFRGPRYVWLPTNYEDLAARTIKAYKFQHKRYLSEDIAGLMTETFWEYNSSEIIKRSGYLVVSLPTATARIRERGFDHSSLLAKTIAQKLNMEYRPVLGRLAQDSQVGAIRTQRLKQLEGKFFVKNEKAVNGRNVLLIDDVLTTGGSLRAAVKCLRLAGAKHVDALVFAKKL